MTAEIIYTGELRTKAKHIRSGEMIITDAPPDNQGRGAYFSPTDLGATSLGCCMVTIMGISARDAGIDISGTKLSIKKVMESNPRRISEVHVDIEIPQINLSDKQKLLLRKAALTCPMAYSLHPDIKQVVTFNI